MQKKMTFLLAVALIAAVGCGSQATTERGRDNQTGRQGASAKDQSAKDQSALNQDNQKSMDLGSNAEPVNLQIKPGQEAQVRLTGIAIDAPVTIKVEPEDSKVRASLDGRMVRIRAEEGATGESTLTLQSGENRGKIHLKVQ